LRHNHLLPELGAARRYGLIAEQPAKGRTFIPPPLAQLEPIIDGLRKAGLPEEECLRLQARRCLLPVHLI
jgi:hypothetical protein